MLIFVLYTFVIITFHMTANECSYRFPIPNGIHFFVCFCVKYIRFSIEILYIPDKNSKTACYVYGNLIILNRIFRYRGKNYDEMYKENMTNKDYLNRVCRENILLRGQIRKQGNRVLHRLEEKEVEEKHNLEKTERLRLTKSAKPRLCWPHACWLMLDFLYKKVVYFFSKYYVYVLVYCSVFQCLYNKPSIVSK